MQFRQPLYRTKEISSVVKTVREHYFPPQKRAVGTAGRSTAKKGDGGLTMDEAMEKLKGFLNSSSSRNTSPAASPLAGQVGEDKKISLSAEKRAIILNLACNLPKEHSNGIRSVVSLPHPVPKALRILVFAPPHLNDLLRENGATIVGGAELVDPIIEGKIEFDRCLASTDMMPVIAKLGRFLGQKGMVPTIKTGTLTNDLVTALKNIHSNLPYIVDKTTGKVPMQVGILPDSPSEQPSPALNTDHVRANIQAVFNHLTQTYGKLCKGGRFIQTATINVASHGGLRLDSTVFYNPRAVSNIPQFILDAAKAKANNSKTLVQ